MEIDFPGMMTFVDFGQEDDSVNIYLSGIFKGTVDFDPDTGSYILADSGVGDSKIFIAKYNGNGTLQWAKQIGGSGQVNLIKQKLIGRNKGFVIAGLFSGTVDFDPGPNVAEYSSVGDTSENKNIFLAKYNPDGELVFVKTMQFSTQQLDFSVDDDYIFLVTNLSGQADFDPGPGVTLIDGMAQSIVYAAYSVGGDLVYAKSIKGAQMNNSLINGGSAISNPELNTIIIAGTYTNLITFNPDGNSIELTQNEINGNAVFYAGINCLTGECLWAKDIESDGFLNVESVSLGMDGRTLIAGSFDGNCDFNPGPGSSVQSTTVREGYISVNNSYLGNFNGVSLLEGDGIEQISTIHDNGYDNLIGGTFSGTFLDLDLSFNEKIVYKQGQSNNIYIVGYNYNPKGAVNEVDKNNHVVVFPNPSSGTVNITRKKEVNTSYSLTDPMGRVVKSGSLANTQAILNFNDITSGMYFLNIDGGVVKLIIR